MLISSASSGTVQARRWVTDHWEEAQIQIKIATGDLHLSTDASGALHVDGFSFQLAPVPIPDAVFNQPATFQDARLKQTKSASATATWDGPNAATATVALDVEISWKVETETGGQPFHAPLPAVPTQLTLGGNGDHVDATLSLRAPGIVWSLAELYELLDASVTLEAATAD